jgi:PST family polysaccharide transporter
MASVITETAMRISDLGFADAIIQRKDITANHLSTCFWIQLAFGILLCGVAIGISPLMVTFFKTELVGPVLAVSSIAFAIAPLRIVHGAILKKNLQFFRFAIGGVLQSLVYLAFAVSLAISGFGVWSLVIANLAGQVTLIIARWILLRWHPSFVFSIQSLKDLWKFSANLTGSRAVHLLLERVDYLIAGRFLAAAALGILDMASKILKASNAGLLMSVTQVTFATFSVIQDEDERLRRGFLKSLSYLSLIFIPAFAGLAIVGPELVKVVLGEQWIPSIVPLQILCLSGILGAMTMTSRSLMRAKGRVDIELKLSLVNLVLHVVALLIGVRYGVVGVAAANASVHVILFPIRFAVISRLISLRTVDYLSALRHIIIGTAIMAAGIFAARYGLLYLSLPDAAVLAILVPLGALIYIGALKAMGATNFSDLIDLLREMLGPYAKRTKDRISSTWK